MSYSTSLTIQLINCFSSFDSTINLHWRSMQPICMQALNSRVDAAVHVSMLTLLDEGNPMCYGRNNVERLKKTSEVWLKIKQSLYRYYYGQINLYEMDV